MLGQQKGKLKTLRRVGSLKKNVTKNQEIEQLALVELSETESNAIYGGTSLVGLGIMGSGGYNSYNHRRLKI